MALALAGTFVTAMALLVMVTDYRPTGNVTLFEAALREPAPVTARATANSVSISPTITERGKPEPLAGPYQSLEIATTPQAPAPVRLIAEAIGVDATIISLGLDGGTGQMEVPNDVRDVGWYRHGPGPGEVGSALLAAHVDGYGQGSGVFFDLKALEPGDEVRIVDADGAEQLFIVGARATYHKDELPLDVLFSRGGHPVLTLVTCGGGFNQTSRSYDSNVVVYAVPSEFASEYLSSV